MPTNSDLIGTWSTGWDYASGGAGEADTLKNNFNAERAPTSSDNVAYGYSVGSVWVYNGTTYTCVSLENGVGKWRSESQTHYCDTWADAVTWLLAGDYAGWFVVIASANGAPDKSVGQFSGDGVSYTATSTIADGGQATIAVLVSGSSGFTVECQSRTISNPIITAVCGSSITLASAFATGGAGYYIWTALPGLRFTGMAINAICQCSASGVWSTFQTYASAPNSVLVGYGANQYGLFKAGGSWLMTYALGFGYVSGYGCNLTSGGWVDLTGTVDTYVSNNITRTPGSYKFTVVKGGYYKVRANPVYNASSATWFRTRVTIGAMIGYATPQKYIQVGEASADPIEYAAYINAGSVITIQGFAGSTGGTMTGCTMTVEQIPSISLIAP